MISDDRGFYYFVYWKLSWPIRETFIKNRSEGMKEGLTVWPLLQWVNPTMGILPTIVIKKQQATTEVSRREKEGVRNRVGLWSITKQSWFQYSQTWDFAAWSRNIVDYTWDYSKDAQGLIEFSPGVKKSQGQVVAARAARDDDI